MFDEKNRLIDQVMKDLPLTKEKIIFTFPKTKVTFQKYVRQIIYQMIKEDFNLLEKITKFPS